MPNPVEIANSNPIGFRKISMAESAEDQSEQSLKSAEYRRYLQLPSHQSKNQSPCPADGKSVFSLLWFSWITPLIKLGFQRPLSVKDISSLPLNMKGEEYYRNFLRAWQKFEHGQWPLMKTIGMAHLWRYHIPMFLLKLFIVATTFLKPLFLRWLLQFLADVTDAPFHYEPYIYTVALAAAAMTQAVAVHFYFWQGVQNALALRGALISLIEQKVLKMHHSVKSKYSAGVIINLCSVDTDNIMSFNWNSNHELWASPAIIVISLVWLVSFLGTAALAGCGIMFLSVLLSAGWLSSLKAKLQKKLMLHSDHRIHLLHEFIVNSKLIKLYNWQLYFAKRILRTRASQNEKVATLSVYGTITRVVGTVSPMLVALATFAIYTGVQNNALNSTTVFTALMLFNIMKEPLSKLPESTTLLVKTLISVKRIENYLLEDDYKNNLLYEEAASDRKIDSAYSYDVKSLSCSWGKSDEIILKNINLQIPKNKLIFIVGPVGSGKSTLLSALLGETVFRDGSIRASPGCRNGSAYCIQQPWIFSDTVRNNILFGEELDLERYISTITNCALVKDLEILADGDLSLIGDQEGVGQLSGGQRQRLALARAVYSKKDVYIFDEPLSAVDAHVAKWLFDRIIGPNGALSDRTRIVVTHRIQFAPEADFIVVMKNGSIHSTGTYEELRNRGVDLASYAEPIDTTSTVPIAQSKVQSLNEAVERFDATVKHALSRGNSIQSIMSVASRTNAKKDIMQQLIDASVKGLSLESLTDASVEDETYKEKRSESDMLAPEEFQRQSYQTHIAEDSAGTQVRSQRQSHESINHSSMSSLEKSPDTKNAKEDTLLQIHGPSGRIGGKKNISDSIAKQAEGVDDNINARGATKRAIYFKYFLVGGSGWFWVTSAAMVLISQGLMIASETFLAQWCNNIITGSQWTSIIIYASLVVAGGFLFWLRCTLIAKATCQSSATLHDALFEAVKNARQEFFDTHTTGRIISRFSRDIDLIDNDLPGVVQDVASCTIASLGTVILIMVLTPACIPFLIPIMVMYNYIQKFYRPSSRDLKRMESASRSPVYSFIDETIIGLTTVRAFGLVNTPANIQEQFKAKHCNTNYSPPESSQLMLSQTSRFLETLIDKLDHNTTFYFYSFAVNRWLGTRLEVVGALMVLVASVGSLLWQVVSYYIINGQIQSASTSSWIALAITATLSISGNLNWMVRQLSELEIQMNAVERICEFADLIEPEEDPQYLLWSFQMNAEMGDKNFKDLRKRILRHRSVPTDWQLLMKTMRGRLCHYACVPKSVKKSAAKYESSTTLQSDESSNCVSMNVLAPDDIPHGWPNNGDLKARHLRIRYRPGLPPVVHDISFEIHGGERIGIVGRTGAGKSTLTLALFRLVRLEKAVESTEPVLTIDGLDISRIPLNILRKGIAIIPQDPVIFSGSMRFNLDPSEALYTDHDLWEVLEKVGLKAWTSRLGGLDVDLSGDSNDEKQAQETNKGETCLSVGQRQLLCLARAVLRKPKVLVMDEATASLDYAADAMIKQFIRKEFSKNSNMTTITIAHRLDTILDSDRIMVFDQGMLVEFDSPRALLDKGPDGYLSGLLQSENAARVTAQLSTVHI